MNTKVIGLKAEKIKKSDSNNLHKLDEVMDKILKLNNPIIAIHLDPDEDCVGSALALAIYLTSQGKKPSIYINPNTESVISEYLKKIMNDNNISIIKNNLEPIYDGIIFLDTAKDCDVEPNIKNLMLSYKDNIDKLQLIEIDHHNTGVLPVSPENQYVDALGSSSTCEILAKKLLSTTIKLPKTNLDAFMDKDLSDKNVVLNVKFNKTNNDKRFKEIEITLKRRNKYFYNAETGELTIYGKMTSEEKSELSKIFVGNEQQIDQMYNKSQKVGIGIEAAKALQAGIFMDTKVFKQKCDPDERAYTLYISLMLGLITGHDRNMLFKELKGISKEKKEFIAEKVIPKAIELDVTNKLNMVVLSTSLMRVNDVIYKQLKERIKDKSPNEVNSKDSIIMLLYPKRLGRDVSIYFENSTECFESVKNKLKMSKHQWIDINLIDNNFLNLKLTFSKLYQMLENKTLTLNDLPKETVFISLNNKQQLEHFSMVGKLSNYFFNGDTLTITGIMTEEECDSLKKRFPEQEEKIDELFNKSLQLNIGKYFTSNLLID